MDIDVRELTLLELLREARDSVEFERTFRYRTNKPEAKRLGAIVSRIDVEVSHGPTKAALIRPAAPCTECGLHPCVASEIVCGGCLYDAGGPCQFTGTKCADCGVDQFMTTSGVSCKNGHGGAPPQEDDIYG